MARRLTSVGLALVVLVASTYAALVGIVFGWGLQCDESCDGGDAWRDDPGAWQWDALGWTSVGLFVAACVLVGGAAFARRGVTLGALAGWAICAVPYGILLVEGESPDALLVGGVTVLVGAIGASSALVLPARVA